MFFGPVLVGQSGKLPRESTGFYIFSLALLLEAMLLAAVSGKGSTRSGLGSQHTV
ncbi:hypothetical protein [Desulfoscipio gibsoniae]|uniref:hypothetical protein n=1 Tax=Desulfoscipio gibsoniae TaxID=102134 RepID=UPI0002D467C9|nr:hypothetical protein [Desulfoscipio gibsoniae]